ncbi:MAG TPA: lysophospholipid acyltransferase family protein [Rhizobiaceae bacterium]|nr:lysophospholipid acyltransferase family protein [Rhizobiaceae bacterium]
MQSREELTPRRARPVKKFWRRIRRPLAQSRLVKNAVASLLAGAIRVIRWTNPLAAGSCDPGWPHDNHEPAIIGLWHGQHLAAPAFRARRMPLVAMFSRSADAELNAMVAQKLGFEVVRGSGGREDIDHRDKGGARALILLRRALSANKNVAMIADIPHGTPRECGLGIVTLARLSGRPIIPAAIATSRRKVLERTWDKTTINLPFGRSAVIFGEPIHVAADADAAEMERKRREVTASLNRATEKAYGLVDGAR